jgi:hypothetical protein
LLRLPYSISLQNQRTTPFNLLSHPLTSTPHNIISFHFPTSPALKQ